MGGGMNQYLQIPEENKADGLAGMIDSYQQHSANRRVDQASTSSKGSRESYRGGKGIMVVN